MVFVNSIIQKLEIRPNKMNNAVNHYLEGIRDGNYKEAINKYTG